MDLFTYGRKPASLLKRVFVFAFLFPLVLASHAISLSDSARVTLLTVSPGEELYSAFGHTGIRVTDYKKDFDVVFNYGTFDFDQPGFYTNFVKGKMRYMIAYEDFRSFMYAYNYEKRSVTEQELRLTTEEKQRVFDFLYNNALPENREYYYDFFWDNCATRPRDVFEKVLGPRLTYDTVNAGFEKDKTMHDMLRVYVHDRPWVDFGFDLILGLPCEVEATPRSQTFLPEYLLKYIDAARIDGQPFVVNKEVLLKFEPVKPYEGFTPLQLCQLIAFAALLMAFIERLRKNHNFHFDFVLFLVAGLLGLLFLSLGIFTSHYSTPKNLNILWLLPTHAVVAFVLLKAQRPVWLRYYFAATAVFMLVLILAWGYLPQPYNPAVKWLIAALGFRAFSIAMYLQKGKQRYERTAPDSK